MENQGRAAPPAVRVAITGNPNSGKTSIFNHLTGTIQSVGNWPGVTVSRKEGKASLDHREFVITDLPGTYSLTAYSLEEMVARNFLIDSKPEVVIDVLDASNLERNLYLMVQLMEMEAPLVVALNMIDVAERRQLKIDTEKMGTLVGASVVPTIGHRGEGMAELLQACVPVSDHEQDGASQRIDYGHEVEAEVGKLAEIIAADPALSDRYVPRWVAVNLVLWAMVYLPRTDEDAAREELVKASPEMSGDQIENKLSEVQLARSVAGRLGTALTPISR